MERLDIYSPKKIISNLHQYKIEMENLLDGNIKKIKLKAALHKFEHILDMIVLLEGKDSSFVSVLATKNVIKILIKKLKKWIKNYKIKDPIFNKLLRDYETDLQVNKIALRNIKSYKKRNKSIIIHLDNKNILKPKYNLFISDYDRIISSSGLRRLQDKTQVYPLEQYDFTRSRLTHSHEVATISELILDLSFAMANCKNYRIMENCKCIMRSASIIHDIGNPPFGHFGEDIIRSYFSDLFSGKRNYVSLYKKLNTIILNMNQQMKCDFINFDGNAQGLRVVSKLQHYKESPLALSASIIGAMIKYPWPSNGNKKYGYFHSENNVIEMLKGCETYKDLVKNPLSMILEASDDIANYISDIEDSVKKGIIDYEKIKVAFDLYGDNDQEIIKFKNEFDRLYKQNIIYFNCFERTMNQLISGIKKQLIHEVAIIVAKSVDSSSGVINVLEKNDHLVDRTKFKNLLKFIKDEFMIKHVYTDYKITKVEIKGVNIMCRLLDYFCDATLNIDIDIDNFKYTISKNKCDYSGDEVYKKRVKIFNMISPNFINIYVNEINNIRYIQKKETEEDVVYYKLKLILDFISGMTDSYIVDFYNKIFC